MGCATLTKEILIEAGVPEGAFDIVNITNDLVSKVIADRRIAAVTVTGSVRAGSAIAAQAGAVLKKTVLELGDSDPFIVLADADLDRAVQAALIGRFQNTGQICIAAKRIILERPIAEAFTERFVEGAKALKWVIRYRKTPISVPWREQICATSCTPKSAPASALVHANCWAASSRRAKAATTQPPFLPMFDLACLFSIKRRLVPSLHW